MGNPSMYKIGQYFNTFEITRGLLITIALSAFIYLHHWNLSYPLINTLLGVLGIYFLLSSDRRVWFWSGAFIGLFWFWWIVISFKHYQMLWAIPLALLFIALGYGLIFWFIAYLSEKCAQICNKVFPKLLPTLHSLLPLTLKSLGVLSLSYIHPFGFDWLKPELIFVESYLGIQKWQFALILFAIVLSQWKQRHAYLFLILFAYHPTTVQTVEHPSDIALISTYISVEDKWDKRLQPEHFKTFFAKIDEAIEKKKRLVILPESVFPLFLNYSPLLDELQKRAKEIDIVTGGLYADGKIPRNSTYIFRGEHILVSNKVVLVPFGESNPLPDFLSDWVNEVFYDGAVDYIASADITDYTIGDKTYRNAICFEATSEKLYEGSPARMIVLSNNGWFVPSTEPTLQKLLLLYYHKKYGTTIYHSVNMSPSYIIKEGMIFSVGAE